MNERVKTKLNTKWVHLPTFDITWTLFKDKSLETRIFWNFDHISRTSNQINYRNTWFAKVTIILIMATQVFFFLMFFSKKTRTLMPLSFLELSQYMGRHNTVDYSLDETHLDVVRAPWNKGFELCVTKKSSSKWCYYVRMKLTDLLDANVKDLIQSGRN